METKKRRSSYCHNLPTELALFGFEQLSDVGILFLQQHGDKLGILHANSCFWNLFGLATNETDDFVAEQFFAQDDSSLFKDLLHKSANDDVRLRILTRKQPGGKYTTITRCAKVACTRFNEEWICCKFQLSDPTLEEKLQWYQIADQQLKAAWGFYRLELDKRDVFSICENPLAKSRRATGHDPTMTSFYCRNDGAVSDQEFDWWLETGSKLSENHPVEFNIRETMLYGIPVILKMHTIFIKRDENGYPIILVIGEDFTQTNKLQIELSDKQKTLNELDLTNKCLKQFFDMAPLHMGIIKLVDNNTDVEYITANRYHETILGRSLSGVKSSELEAGDRVKMWIDRYLQAKESKGVVQFRDSTSGYHLHSYAVHVDGDMFAFLSQDITENYLLEQELKKYQSELEEKIKVRTKQLEEALQVKSRFLATMSHEMRTPLSGSMGAMSLLEETPLTAEQRNLIRIALVCGEQLLSVINDVLDLSKLEENKVVLENEPFDIRNTLEESLEMISLAANKKELELISAIDPSVPQTMIGDSGRMRQIMVNLLSNAVKFSSQGEIVLRAKAKRAEYENDNTYEITISVQDQGIGIQEEDKNKLFQVFTQLDNSVTRRHGGTGLGLSICKKFAELMHGKMWFESTVGKGSTFYASVLVNAVIPFPLDATTYTKPLQCAVIDKSETYAEHLCLLLQTLGHAAKRFESVEDVKEADCLFVDARLPVVCVEQNGKNKIVVLTSYPAQQISIPTGYYSLSKPLREAKLKQLLEQIKNHSITSTNIAKRTDEVGNKWQHLSILLAEDNEMNQQIVTRMLARLSLSPITVVDNGKKAVEKVRSKHFDLILMDMMMPEMGGIEATEIIRKEFGEKPVIVALTANVFTEDQTRCIEAGMQEVLMKPVQKTEFVRILEKYFGTQ